MKSTWIIFRKELHGYFVSRSAYGMLAFLALAFGLFFWNRLDLLVTSAMQAQLSGEPFSMNVNEQLLRPLIGDISVLGLFFIPVITMGLFAEEKRSGTIELLATSPIRDIDVILGKWLAALMLYVCMLACSAASLAFVFRYGNPDWKPVAIGYLGLLLQAGSLLAIGTFISSLTRSQMIAGAATFATCLILWLFGWAAGYETATWAQVLGYMSLISHFDSFTKGVLDSKDVIYYLTLIFLGLFFTSRSLESLRWRS